MYRDLGIPNISQTQDDMNLSGTSDLSGADTEALLDTVFHESAAPAVPMLTEKANEELQKVDYSGGQVQKRKGKNPDGEDVTKQAPEKPLEKGKALFALIQKHLATLNADKLALQGMPDSHLVLPRLPPSPYHQVTP